MSKHPGILNTLYLQHPVRCQATPTECLSARSHATYAWVHAPMPPILLQCTYMHVCMRTHSGILSTLSLQ